MVLNDTAESRLESALLDGIGDCLPIIFRLSRNFSIVSVEGRPLGSLIKIVLRKLAKLMICSVSRVNKEDLLRHLHSAAKNSSFFSSSKPVFVGKLLSIMISAIQNELTKIGILAPDCKATPLKREVT